MQIIAHSSRHLPQLEKLHTVFLFFLQFAAECLRATSLPGSHGPTAGQRQSNLSVYVGRHGHRLYRWSKSAVIELYMPND